MPESGHTITILPEKGKPVILSKRDVAIKRDKVAKKAKVDMEDELAQCSKMTNAKTSTEKRRMLLAPSSSSQEENAEKEMCGEVSASSQAEKGQTQTEVIEEDPLYPNPILEPEQNTETEEREVTEATKYESETIAYDQPQEEEREVPEKVPIQGEASSEVAKKKTRSGRVVRKTEWLG